MKYLTVEEEEKFFQTVKKNKTHSTLFQLMLDYGMRISEIVRLKEENVDMENRRITITRSKRKREPTNDYRLTDECYRKLKSYLKLWRKKEVVKAGNPYLFISQKTAGVNEQMRTWNVGHLFRKYAAMAGISKTNPHCLRHTCAVRLVSKGLSQWDVKDRLWHSSVISSQTYVQLFGEEKKEQDRRCEEALRSIG